MPSYLLTWFGLSSTPGQQHSILRMIHNYRQAYGWFLWCQLESEGLQIKSEFNWNKNSINNDDGAQVYFRCALDDIGNQVVAHNLLVLLPVLAVFSRATFVISDNTCSQQNGHVHKVEPYSTVWSVGKVIGEPTWKHVSKATRGAHCKWNDQIASVVEMASKTPPSCGRVNNASSI